jgi:hypothetical protein
MTEKVTVPLLQQVKRDGRKIVGVVAWDYQVARISERAGVEMALDVPALVVPGQDEAQATSAARYLQECLASSRYWDVPVAQQTQETLRPLLLDFLASASASEITATGTGAATPA